MITVNGEHDHQMVTNIWLAPVENMYFDMFFQQHSAICKIMTETGNLLDKKFCDWVIFWNADVRGPHDHAV